MTEEDQDSEVQGMDEGAKGSENVEGPGEWTEWWCLTWELGIDSWDQRWERTYALVYVDIEGAWIGTDVDA